MAFHARGQLAVFVYLACRKPLTVESRMLVPHDLVWVIIGKLVRLGCLTMSTFSLYQSLVGTWASRSPGTTWERIQNASEPVGTWLRTSGNGRGNAPPSSGNPREPRWATTRTAAHYRNFGTVPRCSLCFSHFTLNTLQYLADSYFVLQFALRLC